MSRVGDRWQRVVSNFDWSLTLTLIGLCAIGSLLLYSAGYSSEVDGSPQMRRQLIAMLAGFGVYFVAMLFPTSFWRRWSPLLFLVGCCLLLAVLVAGDTAGGARRWLNFGPVRFQPSEFMKVAMILMMARIFSSDSAPRDGYSMRTLWIPCVVALIPIGLIRAQPDLGTALCHALIAGSMLLLYGVRTRTLVLLGVLALVSAVPAWFMLEEYQQKRITAFISPDLDPQGSGYHARQSKIAVGSGSVFGKGFRQGTQTQLRFLPEQTTDFIFSVLAEEWGFMGTITVLSLYLYLLAHCLAIARRCSDTFSAMVTVGVAAFLFWHVVVNIGMVVGMLPVVGLTLPLLSFGGSSVVSVMAAFGLVAGVYVRRFLFT